MDGNPLKLHHNFDPTSGTWHYIKANIEEKLATARGELEQEDTSPDRTIALRAQIAMLRAIVALEEPEPEIHDGGSYDA